MKDINKVISLAKSATEHFKGNSNLAAKFAYIWLDNVAYIHDDMITSL